MLMLGFGFAELGFERECVFRSDCFAGFKPGQDFDVPLSSRPVVTGACENLRSSLTKTFLAPLIVWIASRGAIRATSCLPDNSCALTKSPSTPFADAIVDLGNHFGGARFRINCRADGDHLCSCGLPGRLDANLLDLLWQMTDPRETLDISTQTVARSAIENASRSVPTIWPITISRAITLPSIGSVQVVESIGLLRCSTWRKR